MNLWKGDILKFKFYLKSVIFATIFSSIFLNASVISPELEKKIKEEGKWEQFVETLKQGHDNGINQLSNNPLKLKEIINREKNPVYLNALVILVEFSDHLADTTNHNPAAFEHLLFSEGVHATGSMNDYYLENSYNTTGISGEATQWFTMPQIYSYYVNGQYGWGSYPNNAQKLTEDAVAAADPFVDFSRYDNDHDGYVDALFVVHAGPGRENTGNDNDIHSHAWSITPQLRDGVYVSRYSMEPETRNSAGDLVRMGVFSHEFGHVLGVPDMYDKDYSSNGLGKWSVMAGGVWNNGGQTPAHFDAWCKYQLGWLNPVVVDITTIGATLPAVEDTSVSYILWTEGQFSTEYFILENRQQTGFDSYVPSSGLLIYHVDETVTNNSSEWHPKVMLEQADGLFDLQYKVNSGDTGDPFPGSYFKTFFNSSTVPNSNNYNDNLTKVSVSNINHFGGIITADFEVSDAYPILALSHPVIIDSTGDNEGDADPGETVNFDLTLNNTGIAADSVFLILSCSDTQVVLIDSTEYLHHINGDDNIVLNNAFQVSFSPQKADPSYSVFNVSIKCLRGNFIEHFTILVGDSSGFTCDFEGEPGIWHSYSIKNGYYDEWHLEDYLNYTSGGNYSYKVGGNGTADYSNFDDAVLESPFIELGENNDAVLSFYQIMHAEEYNGTVAKDGGMVELSEDGGIWWQQIYPLGGYSHTISNNPTCPFPENTPVFSGQISAWQEQRFDLSPYYGEVKIRFRFGSDDTGTDEGWYIDDVKIENITTKIDVELNDSPNHYELLQNYPNPFNPVTTIEFSIPSAEQIKLSIFTMLGQKLVNLIDEKLEPGKYKCEWNASDFASGIYYYKIQAESGYSKTNKLLLLK